MVKSRFPGKPSKYFNRRKVSGVNSVDADSIKVVRDSILSVSYFNYLFNRNDEDKNSFHGFSPHDEKVNSDKDDKKHSAGTSRKRKRHNLSPRKPTHSVIEVQKNNITTQDNVTLLLQLSDNAPTGEESKENTILPVSSESNEVDSKDDIPSNPTLSGKFVLPSRSAHSSRVIKPNKRFLHNDSSSVPSKKSRVMNLQESVETTCVSEVTDHAVSVEPPIIKRRRGRPKNSEISSKTSVKFVLRKPRLKIKSQTLPTVGGPFSSPSGNSLSLQGTKYQSPSVKKVFCGVCGSLRTFKFLQHARKFGIFSCVPCRKFILRIIRTERKNVLKPLSCSSGLGNCPIRQNTLASQCFSNDNLENSSNESDRCEACWLNLCLRSFHISPKLVKRLTAFLPQILQKSIVNFNTSITDVEKNNPFGVSSAQLTPGLSNETRVIRKNKGLRESIHIRRGSSNTALRLSSHRGRTVRDSEDVKRGRGRQQKLPVAGPRVKHVCRSASLVLGQPVATFNSNTTKAGEYNEDPDEVTNTSEDVTIKEQTSNEITNVVPGGSESDRRIPEIETEQLPEEVHHFDYPPVARMLQDLGRANCELLDGMENHETAKLNARVSIDFWESYDPEEVIQMGFPLIGFSPLRLRSVCFLCGSAGLEKMIHCASCCEPYHTFCVSNKMNPNPTGDWWRLDWLCPKCTQCEACLRTGGSLLSCAKCQKSYHSSCISAVRINSCDNNWVCPDCLFCKSCNDSNVHFFVGNMPLCKNCFKLRQKGNFCPLCQCCYDENDYSSKMMECAECKCWIHAQCEGISNEKYQVLSYLPSSVEFICRVCCKDPPAHWSLAVEAELRAGYLNVIKILSKNKNACAMFKASPKKQRVCVCLDKRRNPIHLTNLLGSSDSDTFSIDSPMETSPDRDYKSTDLGLLTPKLTKDDEESLKTVKSDFLNLVTDKEESNFSRKTLDNKTDRLSSEKNSQLLAIVFEKLDNPNNLCLSNTPDKNPTSVKEKCEITFQERTCTCQKSDTPVTPSLSLLTVKCKATCDEYRSVIDFHNDMEKVTNEIGNSELIDTYKRCLKQIFPWFDPNLNDSISGPILTDIDLEESKKLIESPKLTNDIKHKKEKSFELRGLLNLEQTAYYIGMDYTDTRSCLLCKKVGEGQPMREGRLLYCGQNEWVHTNCAIWSSEVFEEIDGSLQNVYSAVSRARLIRCSYCNKKGASLGCCAKSCPSAYHFGCAFSAECIFLESKEVFCKVHYSFRGDKEIHKEEDFFIKRSVYVELDHKKSKNVLKNEVKVYIGALEVNQIGEVVPDLSDNPDVIVPCEFWCSRLFWSCKEPWKIVRYSIRTKVTNFTDDFSYENETNYTVDHSLEFTPPPSPIESLSDRFSPDNEKDIKTMISHIIDTICSKEEDKNLSDQQNADFLPPELKDVIYDDLPKDFLDRITVNDIFTKMSFDDLLSESKGDKNDNTDVTLVIEPQNNKLNKKTTLPKGRNNQIIKVVSAMNPKAKIKECQVYLDREPVNKWKRQSILQVDGAMDLSESDQSNDSCDIEIKREEIDEPVKCVRCRRTYRTNLSYKRHLSTCTSEYLSGSESDLSEEEKTQGVPEDSTIKPENDFDNCETMVAVQDSQLHVFSLPIEGKSIHSNEQKVHFVQNAFENSMVCVNDSNLNGVCESTESLINVNYTTLNESVSSSYPGEQTLVATSVDTVVSDQMVGLQQPTIIVQQMGGENVIPYSSIQPQLPTYQESQQPNVQYITAFNTQEKTQYLTANAIGSTAYHIQPQLSTPLVQNVPTVVGTIVQSNGMEQLVLNNPTSSLDVYGQQQNNMYITNTPMIVGMETVVSNTVMQSSRFITGAPGMLASSYSATTTQVFQAAKPVIDIPQGYVVVNTNPPSIMENTTSCVPNIIQNGSVTNPTWNSYKINYQDAIKINKNASYEPMTLQVLPNNSSINGMKSIEANVRNDDQTLLVSSMPPSFKPLPAITEKASNSIQIPTTNNSNVIAKPSSSVKIVELPSSSAVHKEKPQQAVAPVVIKKVPELKIEKPLPVKCNDVVEQQSSVIKEEPPCQVSEINSNEISSSTEETKTQDTTRSIPSEDKPELKKEDTALSSTSKKANGVVSKGIKRKEVKDPPVKKVNGLESVKKRKVVQEEPKITFEISTEDGFYYNTTNLEDAWNKVYETVQNARKSKNLPLLTQNPFSSPDTMLKKMMGLGNNSMKYLLEQLPGISSCSKYKPIYHKKPPTALEKELYRGGNVNPSGCARSEKFKHAHKTYDMFSWLASRHRRPPKLLYPESDGLNGNSRRATSMSLPMAMRFRHLKETSKHSVGVFRSDIHGRGLFCLRDIDPGEMVIEYAGEVIRSALTDKRERYYTEKGIGCYMFRIDDRSVVDATMKGNAARFINHSCEPNCYSRVIDILGKKHIVIFALRKIRQGEELTYDYKFPLEEDKINCHCLSRKCRKYLN